VSSFCWRQFSNAPFENPMWSSGNTQTYRLIKILKKSVYYLWLSSPRKHVVSNCTLCNPYGGKVREFAILSTTLTVDPIGLIWYSKQRVESKNKQTNKKQLLIQIQRYQKLARRNPQNMPNYALFMHLFRHILSNIKYGP
jgi:hypothetical protein